MTIKEKKTYIILENPKNKDFILSIKYVSSDRLVIPNIIILNKKNPLKKFFIYNNLDKNISIVISDIKYNNNKLFLC